MADLYERLARCWPVIRVNPPGKTVKHQREYVRDLVGSLRPYYTQTDGLTYFLAAPDLGAVKIGCSTRERIGRRLQQIDGTCPVRLELRLVLPGRTLEKYVHMEFADWRFKGEWFELNPVVDLFISELKADYESRRYQPPLPTTSTPEVTTCAQ